MPKQSLGASHIIEMAEGGQGLSSKEQIPENRRIRYNQGTKSEQQGADPREQENKV